MKKLLYPLWLLCLLSFAAVAQTNTNAPAKKTTSFVNMTEAGMLFGKLANGNNRDNFTFVTYNGYSFNSNISAGVIVGADAYNTTLIIPMGVGTRVCLGRPTSKLNPLFSFDAGYGLPVGKYHSQYDKFAGDGDAKGGYMFNPSAGVEVNAGKKLDLTITLGFKQQKVTAQFPPEVSQQVKQKDTYNSITLRMGVSF